MDECVIVLPTFSQYLDFSELFLSMLKKNWHERKYKVVVAIAGKKTDNYNKLSGAEVLWVEDAKLLTDCLVKAKEMFPAKYYMSFLGDALMMKKVNDSEVRSLLQTMKMQHLDYCKLIANEKIGSKKLLRRIKYNEAYAHSFIAFIASPSFIENELSGISDFEFESKYLKIAYSDNSNREYSNRAILCKDIFHIRAGIVKGKWTRRTYNRLKRMIPKDNIPKRELLSFGQEVYLMIATFCFRHIPNKFYRKLHKN